MPRILLLLPTRTYRTEDFLAAALGLGVEVVVASERANALAAERPDELLALDFLDPAAAAREAAAFARAHPLDAVVPVDDDTTVVAAAISAALGQPHNSVASAAAARDKHLMRALLARAGVPVPHYTLCSLDEDPGAVAARVGYPCVVKPLFLSASRGVIRADEPDGFVAAVRRLAAILEIPDVAERGGEAARQYLVEAFVPGEEVALEGLLLKGELQVLALFDKPDPLEGPFFEETIYVTPSRLGADVQAEIAATTARAARALGLVEGPIHAELRVNRDGPWVIEIAARSIGGLCSRTLRFGTGLSLEELILRHALGMEIPSLERERRAAGVMMLPIPRRGTLREVRGQDAAKAVPGVEEVAVTAHLGQELIPLPEGAAYLGFLFARAETPEAVEAALHEAHRRLDFVIA